MSSTPSAVAARSNSFHRGGADPKAIEEKVRSDIAETDPLLSGSVAEEDALFGDVVDGASIRIPLDTQKTRQMIVMSQERIVRQQCILNRQQLAMNRTTESIIAASADAIKSNQAFMERLQEESKKEREALKAYTETQKKENDKDRATNREIVEGFSYQEVLGNVIGGVTGGILFGLAIGIGYGSVGAIPLVLGSVGFGSAGFVFGKGITSCCYRIYDKCRKKPGNPNEVSTIPTATGPSVAVEVRTPQDPPVSNPTAAVTSTPMSGASATGMTSTLPSFHSLARESADSTAGTFAGVGSVHGVVSVPGAALVPGAASVPGVAMAYSGSSAPLDEQNAVAKPAPAPAPASPPTPAQQSVAGSSPLSLASPSPRSGPAFLPMLMNGAATPSAGARAPSAGAAAAALPAIHAPQRTVTLTTPVIRGLARTSSLRPSTGSTRSLAGTCSAAGIGPARPSFARKPSGPATRTGPRG